MKPNGNAQSEPGVSSDLDVHEPLDMTYDNEYVEEAEAASAGHLMRVRVRKPVWQRLQAIAEEEGERLNCHVTASDIVRAALGHYLGLHESVIELRNMPPESIGAHTLVFDGIA